jgi:thymidylate synthase
VLNTLKKNPYDRRMIVMAWNPLAMDQMGLPPCHYGYQLIVTGDGDDKRLNLIWEQRSVDTMLGLPFNIASYGLLLHLISKESGIKAGKLIGQLGDVHIYENHLEGTHEFLSRDPEKYPLPTVVTDPFMTVFEWEASHSRLEGYESYPKIELPIAV